ncbi:MAG: hypothetical protein C1941_09215 [Prosthecochloris sp.]|nr:hypothetical protein [Prosthecochloris sp.]
MTTDVTHQCASVFLLFTFHVLLSLLPFALCLLPFDFCLLPFHFCLLPFDFCLLPFDFFLPFFPTSTAHRAPPP